jgi:hypothetical protein
MLVVESLWRYVRPNISNIVREKQTVRIKKDFTDLKRFQKVSSRRINLECNKYVQESNGSKLPV